MAGHSDRLLSYLRGIQDRDSIRPADLESRVEGVGFESMGGDDRNRQQISEQAFESFVKLDAGRPLDQGDLIRLEAIVLPNGLRPAFDVVNDSFENLPLAFEAVNDQRSAVEEIIRGVGRLNLTGHPTHVYGGTAFVVAQDTVMTNRHVAEFFLSGLGDANQVTFIAGRSGSVDLKQEVGSTASVTLQIVEPIVILDEWDAALLRVTALPAAVTPLHLAGAAPSALEGRVAAVVGYPAIDDGSDIIQQIQIFRVTFNKKRLMPGRLMGMKTAQSYDKPVTAVAHDCTTLGGNSGSAVVDVQTGLVVGLHFGGEYLVANYAVPSWELAKDTRVTAAKVAFA